METAAGDRAAFGEAVVFLSHFKTLEDPRQLGKVVYRLDEILLLCLLAVLAGSETFVDIARFGEKKIDLLRRFRPFVHGTPAHDHLGDIFAVLDAAAVDGQIKAEFDTHDRALKTARDLKGRFPTLQVNVYDAEKKHSEKIEIAAA